MEYEISETQLYEVKKVLNDFWKLKAELLNDTEKLRIVLKEFDTEYRELNKDFWNNDKVQRLIDLCLYRNELQTKNFIHQKLNKILNQFDEEF